MDSDVKVYFTNYLDIYTDKIRKEEILTWIPEITSSVPECMAIYYANRVYIAMTVMNEGVFYVINTATKIIEDKKVFLIRLF